MSVSIILVNNANQSKQKVCMCELPISIAALEKVARNKLQIKAKDFFDEQGNRIDDNSETLTNGTRVFCSCGEPYIGAALTKPGATVSAVIDTTVALPVEPIAGTAAAYAAESSDAAASEPADATDASRLEVERVALPGEKGEISWLRVGSGRLALWHKPGGKASAKLRQIAGATAVLTLLAEREGAETIGRQARAAGLTWHWRALDGADAEYLQTDEAVAELVAATVDGVGELRSGGSLLVHCSAGIHRTGTVGYALLRTVGWSAAESRAGLAAMRTATAEGVDHAAAGRASGGQRTAIAERLVVPQAASLLSADGEPERAVSE